MAVDAGGQSGHQFVQPSDFFLGLFQQFLSLPGSFLNELCYSWLPLFGFYSLNAHLLHTTSTITHPDFSTLPQPSPPNSTLPQPSLTNST
ncbi:MAG: hypothetical protein L0922_06060, partial [Candidatus Mariimomonas ferrooxydans]